MGMSVKLDDTGIVRILGNGDVERLAWDDLQCVEIVTTDEGPFLDDLFWLLHGQCGGVLVPGGQAHEIDLLGRLQALPGFDNEAAIRAAGSTENARFRCWERLRLVR